MLKRNLVYSVIPSPSSGPYQEHREGADLPNLQGALHPSADPALPAQRLPQMCERAAHVEPRGLF